MQSRNMTDAWGLSTGNLSSYLSEDTLLQGEHKTQKEVPLFRLYTLGNFKGDQTHKQKKVWRMMISLEKMF